MIDVQAIWKQYPGGGEGRSCGVGKPGDGVSFHVQPAEIFGLIGPDGAGKTTLIKLLATLLAPSGGSASLNGWSIQHDVRSIRAHIGYMPAVFSLYQDLTVEENLKFFATLFNTTIEKNYHLVRDIYCQIEPFKHRRAGALSGGMKQKLALSCALIHSPLILFLDEPTTGVDPVSRNELWSMLRALASRGVTVVVSTAYMDEASLCDRIALMLDGEVVRIDTPRGTIDSYPYTLYSVSAKRMHLLLEKLRLIPFVRSSVAFCYTHHVTLQDGYGVDDLRHALQERGAQDIEIKTIVPTVEDAFMALVARG